MKVRYMVVIREVREDGAVLRRIIRRRLFPEKAEAIRQRWAERYAGRDGFTVTVEVDW